MGVVEPKSMCWQGRSPLWRLWVGSILLPFPDPRSPHVPGLIALFPSSRGKLSPPHIASLCKTLLSGISTFMDPL